MEDTEECWSGMYIGSGCPELASLEPVNERSEHETPITEPIDLHILTNEVGAKASRGVQERARRVGRAGVGVVEDVVLQGRVAPDRGVPVEVAP